MAYPTGCWVLLFPGIRQQRSKANHPLHLASRLRTNGITHPLPHTLSWQANRQLYFITQMRDTIFVHIVTSLIISHGCSVREYLLWSTEPKGYKTWYSLYWRVIKWESNHTIVTFEFLMGWTIKISVLWNVTLWSLVDIYWCFSGICYIYRLPWRWRQQVPLKCLYSSTRLHDFTFQESVIFKVEFLAQWI
jgi:hypothetical protein